MMPFVPPAMTALAPRPASADTVASARTRRRPDGRSVEPVSPARNAVRGLTRALRGASRRL